MVTKEQEDLLIERLKNRVDKANTLFLMHIGEKLKQIKSLNYTEATRLIQILKYGGEFDDILQQLAEYTGMNIKDIDEILSNYAKKDLNFYKKFYKYRNIPFKEITENKALTYQLQSISNMVKQEMYSFARNNVLGYTIRDTDGKLQFYGLRETYNRVLDEAFMNVSQGKQTFDTAMTQILKDIGGSGLKTINYKSGRAVRLDSAIRMHLQDSLRTLHNANQEIVGEEFGYNGIEVTHHMNAAPDHIDTIDGKQFALIDKIQEQISKGTEKQIKRSDIKDNTVIVKDKTYKDFNDVNNSLDRKVSTLNCRHTIFPIIVGVSQPEYTEEELQRDKELNEKGFDFEGKHYTMYQGEQKQRQIESEIRKQKDIQMLARKSGNDDLAQSSQMKINTLSNKYKELSDVSGLPTYNEKLKVSGFRKTKIDSISNEISKYKTPREKEIDIFNDYTKELKTRLTDNEINSIEGYKGIAHKEINETLLFGKPKKEIIYSNIDNIKQDIEYIDSALSKSKTPLNIRAFRGIDEDYITGKIGDTFTIKGYNSSSLFETIGIQNAKKTGKRGVLLEILTPKNTNAIYIGNNFNGLNEQELLITRDLSYKIIDIKYIVDKNYGNYKKYIVKVIK